MTPKSKTAGANEKFAPAFCLVWVVKRRWDVGAACPGPPLRLAAMRSLTVCPL